jgi:hypothetical protein
VQTLDALADSDDEALDDEALQDYRTHSFAVRIPPRPDRTSRTKNAYLTLTLRAHAAAGTL